MNEIISAGQLANLRASLYAGRWVTRGEVLLLLEAYDHLRRLMPTARGPELAGSPYGG